VLGVLFPLRLDSRCAPKLFLVADKGRKDRITALPCRFFHHTPRQCSFFRWPFPQNTKVNGMAPVWPSPVIPPRPVLVDSVDLVFLPPDTPFPPPAPCFSPPSQTKDGGPVALSSYPPPTPSSYVFVYTPFAVQFTARSAPVFQGVAPPFLSRFLVLFFVAVSGRRRIYGPRKPP